MATEKKPADPHKDCPAEVWDGVQWVFTNHVPHMVVPRTREAMPLRTGPAASAPVPRPQRDTELHAEVAKLTVQADGAAKLISTLIADLDRLRGEVAKLAATAAKAPKAV